MGDPLSGAASILAVLNLAAQSCGCLYDFFRSFLDASEDLRHYAVTLQALQSAFTSISTLEIEFADPHLFTPDFHFRMQECMLDLRALEGLIKPAQTRYDKDNARKIWARVRWASVDQKAKLRRCLEKIDRHRTAFQLDLLLLNTRLSYHSRHDLVEAAKAHRQLLQYYPDNTTSPMVDPTNSDVKHPAASCGSVSLRSSLFQSFEYDFWRFYSSFGANTSKSAQNRFDCSSRSRTANGYGITFGVAMLGPISFRIELALYLIANLWSNQFSLSWSLNLPRTISWDAPQVEFVRSGNARAVQKMFSERRATPFDLLPDGSTLLHIVASRNHTDVLALLLQEGANVNAMNDFGETPLHSAIALAKDYNVSRLLVQNGADLQNKNAEGKTPLHTFFNVVVQQILRCHSDYLDLSALDHGGMTLLHYLAWSSKTSSDDFDKYRQQSHLSLLNVNAEGQSVLHLAAQRGNIAIMRYITQADGVFKTLKDLKDARGRTALHSAVENKRGVEAVAVLLSHGADIRARDHHGRSVLHHAARLGRLPVVESLVKALKPNMVDEMHVADIWGKTPEMVAVSYNAHHIAVFLQEEIANSVQHGEAPMETLYLADESGSSMMPASGGGSGGFPIPSVPVSAKGGGKVPLQLRTAKGTLDTDGDLTKEGRQRFVLGMTVGKPGQLKARCFLTSWVLVGVLLLWGIVSHSHILG